MRRLFVLRPEPGCGATVARARAMGLDAEAMPLFAIEPMPWDAPDAGAFDALLLTSANAVRHGGDKLHAMRGLKVLAVGEATAAAAREAGFDILRTGDAGVEPLLESVEPGLRLLHLCGEDRIEMKPPQEIVAVPVYRARALPRPARFERISGQTIAIHSPRAGKRASELAAETRGQVRVAAISPAAAAATGDGWECCEAAEQSNDRALLALAARLCDIPGQQ